MNKRMIGFLVLVLVILAFAMFAPNGISAAGPKQYKIIYSGNAKILEDEVTKALNDGWTLVGGVSNGDGLMQAVVK